MLAYLPSELPQHAATGLAAVVIGYVLWRLLRPGQKKVVVHPGLNEDITLPHTEPLELYHNVLSGCSGKIRIGLAEKGVKYKANHIHLIETGWYQTCSPDFKKINPSATVPVLVHNGHPIYESHEQIQYVEQMFDGPTLRPADKAEEVDLWVDFASLTGEMGTDESMQKRLGCCLPGVSIPLFIAMVREIPYHKILWGLLHHPHKDRPVFFTAMKLIGPAILTSVSKLTDLVQRTGRAIRAHMKKMNDETLADGRPYLVGNVYTLADVGMITIFERMDCAGFSHLYQDQPNVVAYWNRVKARRSYKEAILDQELPIIARGREQIKKWKVDRKDWCTLYQSI